MMHDGGGLMVAKLRIYLFILEKQGNSSLSNEADGCFSHSVNLSSKDIGFHFTAAIFQKCSKATFYLKETSMQFSNQR